MSPEFHFAAATSAAFSVPSERFSAANHAKHHLFEFPI
jgi:hypothetical protein